MRKSLMGSILEQETLQSLPPNGQHPSNMSPISRHVQVPEVEAAAAALLRLWHEGELGVDPLVFLGDRFAHHRHHQAYFLDTIVERREVSEFEHIVHWERFDAPA